MRLKNGMVLEQIRWETRERLKETKEKVLVTANLQGRIEMKSMYLCVLEESVFSVKGTTD